MACPMTPGGATQSKVCVTLRPGALTTGAPETAATQPPASVIVNGAAGTTNAPTPVATVAVTTTRRSA